MAKQSTAKQTRQEANEPASRAQSAKQKSAAPNLDRVIHERLRLGIISALAANESLVIQAANETRPHLRMRTGEIAILGAGANASLTLGGLLVEGALRIDGDIETLRVLHCTFVPGRSVEQERAIPPSGPSIVVTPTSSTGAKINTALEVEIALSIVGALRMPSHMAKLWLLDSIVDGVLTNGGLIVEAVSDAALTSGPPAHIERCTLFGTSRFLKLEMASESIFTGVVTVEQRQQGCVRFSFVRRGSATPQQYRCQPALEIQLEAIDGVLRCQVGHGGTP